MKSVTLLFALLFSGLATAQMSSSGFRLGIMDIRGETAKDPGSIQPGTDLGFIYALPFQDERWQFTAEVNQSMQSVERDFGGEPNQFYRGSVQSTTFQAGLRYYIGNSINRYNPYYGQLLPYVGASAGLNISSVNLDHSNLNIPMQVDESLQTAASGEINLGIQMVINKEWRVEVYGAGRYLTTDYLDGISGHTDVSDVLLRGGIGLSYTF